MNKKEKFAMPRVDATLPLPSRPRLRLMSALSALSALPVAVLLAACATETAGLNAPAAGGATLPQVYQFADPVQVASGTAQTLSLADEAWWTPLGDAQLNALVDRVLASNLSLGVSALRARQAALKLEQTQADRLPSVAGSVSTQAASQLNGGGTARSSSAALSARWELDLWGRLATLRDAQQWEANATQDDRRAVAMSLVGSTVRLYWQLAYLDQRVASSRQSLDYVRKTLKLVQVQYKAGALSGLDLAQAQQTVSVQEAALSASVQTRMETHQTLALLLDGPTQGATLPEQPLWPVQGMGDLAHVAPGLPAETLARRPDLRAAEARLRKAFATVDAARKAFYPTLSLTGSVGGSSESLTRVLSDPLGTLAASLTLPFLAQGEMRRDVAVSQADADAAVLNFRQTLYQALSDVDKGLSAQQRLSEQLQSQEARLAQARKVERLTELRYRTGAEPLKTWLDAQESRRSAEKSLAENRLNRLKNAMTLYQALGGPVPAGGNGNVGKRAGGEEGRAGG